MKVRTITLIGGLMYGLGYFVLLFKIIHTYLSSFHVWITLVE